jgi:hypothetical protein
MRHELVGFEDALDRKAAWVSLRSSSPAIPKQDRAAQ